MYPHIYCLTLWNCVTIQYIILGSQPSLLMLVHKEHLITFRLTLKSLVSDSLFIFFLVFYLFTSRLHLYGSD
jgi:hypothetical protein